MAPLPGERARWNGQGVQVVDPDDPKLRIFKPHPATISLVVAANGQLVWVLNSELEKEESDGRERRRLDGADE